jgi:sortase (surface protein transpeptidase)
VGASRLFRWQDAGMTSTLRRVAATALAAGLVLVPLTACSGNQQQNDQNQNQNDQNQNDQQQNQNQNDQQQNQNQNDQQQNQ